jgi:cytochrome c-type biogenesis protein CcmH
MARQAESLSFANDGQVTPNARRLFAEAARIDPKNARAPYYLALAKLQSGKRREALEDWRGLVPDAAPDEPWLPALRQRIARLSAELDGGAPVSPSVTQTAPGPSASDIKAAQSMSKGDRSAMIRSMVQRLADRLKDEPDDADGWLRLGRAYGVLGEQRKSRDAYGRAAKLRPGDITVLTSYAQILLQIAAKGETPPELADLGRRMLALDPKNANGLWLAGLAAKAADDGEAAGRHWRLLLSLLAPGAPERKRVIAEIKALAKE